MRSSRLFDLIAPPLLGAVALALLVAEARRPLRARTRRRMPRWTTNAALAIPTALVVRGLVVPVLATSPRGLLARAPLPRPLRALLAVVVLDGTTWLWHRMNHRWRALWRFHEVHHLDRDLDVTTAFRFHAGEMALSVLYRALQQRALGPGPGLALLHEGLTHLAAAFHHADIDLGARLDRALSTLVVTPRMHGIHHSQRFEETDSNWGVIFSFWDVLAGTLRLDVPQPSITIGAPRAPERGELGAPALLALPFSAEGAAR